ncbi:MAG: protein-export chaperone SecB [Acidobacteriota bacterium]|nr:protein-export chaperone SecB [Acidobacteriota bacterium]
MRLAPLQLENYFVKSLRFDLRSGFDSRETLDDGVTLPDFNVTANVTQDTDDPLRARCELIVELLDDPSDKFPYTFAITLIGIFHVSANYPEDQVALLLRVNASSILYSAAREIVLSFSGRGSFPPVILPSVSFAPSPDETAKKQHQTSEAATRKPAPSQKKTSGKKTRANSSSKAAKK